MNPFDIKQALLAKHAQHVVLIHFPIALCMAGVAFDLVAQWTKNRTLAVAAYYNFTVAAASVLPVLVTGLLAWQFQLEGQRLKGVLLLHLVMGIVSGAVISMIWYMHFRSRRAVEVPPARYRVPLELLGVAIVAFTAHLGGFLSGINISN